MRAVRKQLDVAERPARRWPGVNRKLFHYQQRRASDEPLRLRMIALAGDHHRFEFPRLTVLLRRKGFDDNPKRMHRIYVDANLQVRKRVKRKLALDRGPVEAPAPKPNDRWNLDFTIGYAPIAATVF